ncbi:hypothetical protein [Streptomyces sp. NPDC004721]
MPQAPSYTGYVTLIALFMAADGGLTIVLRTLRSQVIPPAAFGTTLSLTILLALTPPPYLNSLIGACALLQALTLLAPFLQLRNDPALRARTPPPRNET